MVARQGGRRSPSPVVRRLRLAAPSPASLQIPPQLRWSQIGRRVRYRNLRTKAARSAAARATRTPRHTPLSDRAVPPLTRGARVEFRVKGLFRPLRDPLLERGIHPHLPALASRFEVRHHLGRITHRQLGFRGFWPGPRDRRSAASVASTSPARRDRGITPERLDGGRVVRVVGGFVVGRDVRVGQRPQFFQVCRVEWHRPPSPFIQRHRHGGPRTLYSGSRCAP